LFLFLFASDSHNGQLARSKNMGAKIIKNEKGHEVYDIGKYWVGEEYETGELEKNSKGEVKLDDTTGEPIKVIAFRYHLDLIKEKFLKPSPVCWATPATKRSVISVACGDMHLLVAARDGDLDSKVYSSGNNGFGQLGHGDQRERHELTSVRTYKYDNCAILLYLVLTFESIHWLKNN
jgi:alpha-tubulin suppressor-like RCC1 family protein